MQCGRKSQKIIERYVQLFLIYFQSLSVEENVFWTDTQSLEHISGFTAWCRHTAASQQRVKVVMQK